MTQDPGPRPSLMYPPDDYGGPEFYLPFYYTFDYAYNLPSQGFWGVAESRW